MSDKDVLLGLTGRQYRDVTVMLPDGTPHVFHLQSLTVSERCKFLDSMWDAKANKPTKFEDVQCRLVAMTLVDENKQLLFKASERTQLLAIDGGVLGQLYMDARELCALSGRAVEDAKGNSSETPDEDS